MAYSGQGIQFFCSKCNTLLKEAVSLDKPPVISEECPGCGSQLSETLQTQVKPGKPSPHIPFQTAYEINARLTCGIQAIDSFLELRIGDRLCVTGSYSSLLVARLCARALMPIRQGGLGAQSVVFVDAGNSSDIYQCVSFARQFGLETQKVLGGIVVSRAFTIYQLAGVMAYELPKAIRRFNARLVVISDLLKMFTQDPQVSRKEATYLISEIMESVLKIKDVLLVMSLGSGSPYDGQIMPAFGKRVEITRAGHLDVKLHDGSKSKQILMPDRELRIASFRLPEWAGLCRRSGWR